MAWWTGSDGWCDKWLGHGDKPEICWFTVRQRWIWMNTGMNTLFCLALQGCATFLWQFFVSFFYFLARIKTVEMGLGNYWTWGILILRRKHCAYFLMLCGGKNIKSVLATWRWCYRKENYTLKKRIIYFQKQTWVCKELFESAKPIKCYFYLFFFLIQLS